MALKKILAVIVLYQQQLENSSTFITLTKALEAYGQEIDIFVYDNSPSSTFTPKKFPYCNLIYLHNSANPGISKAYNEAAKFASKVGKSWLLLLDQDSSLPMNFLDLLLKDIAEFETDAILTPILKQNDVILSPCRFKLMKGSALKNLDAGPLDLKEISLLNSGMCVNLEAFIKAGGYNEEVKLDFSDHAFINRIKKKYNRIIVTGAIVEHQLSSNSGKHDVVYNRFRQYCTGIKAYIQSEDKSYLLLLWTGLRAVKLFVIYRDFNFLRTFFSCF